jgi:hypothetical protein
MLIVASGPVNKDITDFKESKLIGCVWWSDDQSSDMADINFFASDGDSYRFSGIQFLYRPGMVAKALHRSDPFCISASSYGQSDDQFQPQA